MFSVKGIRACCAVLAFVLSLLLSGPPAWGDSALGAQPGIQSYAVEESSLEQALIRFSLESGVDVLYADAVLAHDQGDQPVRLSGTYTPRAALAVLLRGRGLTPLWRSESLAVIQIDRPRRAPTPELPIAVIRPAPIDVITVRGVAGAARRSIARKRFNDVISETLSSDDMGNLANANLTEALARLPGLNAVRNQATGEGDRITIRGLSSEYNAYSMNGVRLGGTGSPNDYFYRGVRLSFLSPEGVEQITVRKTATPDADGDVIGGAIDIETPLAFDFEDDYTSLALELHAQDRFDRGVSPAISGALARTWNDRWGIFIAGFHDRQRYGYDQIGDNGDHLPLHWYADAEAPDAVWDYDSFQTRGWELSQGLADVERYGLNGALSWRNDAHALHLRGQTNRYVETVERHQLKMRNRAGDRSRRFRQADSLESGLLTPDQWRQVGEDEALGAIYGYEGATGWIGDVTLDQIEDVDGDGLLSDADARCRSYYSLCGASGLYDPQDFSLSREMGVTRLVGQASSIDLAGESRFNDAFEIRYALAYARSREDIAYDYEVEFEVETGEDAPNSPLFELSSIGLTGDNPRFPQLDLSPALLNEIQTLSHYGFGGLDVERSGVRETLMQGSADLIWRPRSGALYRLQAGVKLTRSERERREGEPVYDPDMFEGLTLADLDALHGADITDHFNGRYQEAAALGQTLNADAFIRAVNADFANASDSLSDGFSYDELSAAAYVMGEWRVDDLSVLAGVRAARIEYDVGGYYTTLQADPELDPLPPTSYAARSEYWAVLPSVHLTQRFGRGWVARAALWSSYARPPIERATQPVSVSLIDRAAPGPEVDVDSDTYVAPDPDLAVSAVRIGNVDLSPSRAFNADLALDWYQGQQTALSAALFYKSVDNFMVRRQSSVIRSGATAPAELERVRERLGLGDLPLTEDFTLEMADQGGALDIYGVELSARHMFETGPAWRQGLGYALTATYQSSRVETGMSWHPEGYALPLFEAPDWLLGAEAFWVRETWQAYISWLYQSAFLEDYETFRHEPYEQPYAFVDLSIKRTLGRGAQISLDVQNLLDGPTYWYTFGTGEERLREYREAGRTLSLGLSWRF